MTNSVSNTAPPPGAEPGTDPGTEPAAPDASPTTGRGPVPAAPASCPAHGGTMRLYGDEFFQDPTGLYRELRRRHGPVAPILLEGDVPAWFVLGYREVHHVSSNSQLFARDSRRWHAWDSIPEDWPLMPFVGYQPSVMFTEGEEHRQRAGAIGAALGAVDQFELRGICEEVADDLIDAFAGGGAADLKAGFAHPMPLRVVARLFGLPESQAPQLVRDMIESLDVEGDALAAHLRVRATMEQLLAAKRDAPGPDVPSRLLSLQPDLSSEELIQDLLVVITAAQQPTANWIGNTLRLMLTDDRFAVTLSGGRRSVGQAMNEVLWEDTPTQNFLGRFATQATELGGQRIEAGDLLVLGLAAANADPQVRPDAYADQSSNQAHLSFGHGEHGCPFPAPELAEVIARTAVEVLLDRLPDVVLEVEPEELVWRPSVWMRGLEALPVRFTPVPVSGYGAM